HRGDESGRELAPPQYDVDERAADAPLPSANGWMVSNCACAIAAWTSAGMSLRWRHEIRLPWIEPVTSDPVLKVAELARDGGGRGREHQHAGIRRGPFVARSDAPFRLLQARGAFQIRARAIAARRWIGVRHAVAALSPPHYGRSHGNDGAGARTPHRVRRSHAPPPDASPWLLPVAERSFFRGPAWATTVRLSSRGGWRTSSASAGNRSSRIGRRASADSSRSSASSARSCSITSRRSSTTSASTSARCALV